MTWEVMHGECVTTMELCLAEVSIDAIVTDGPYELGFMGKRWDGTGVTFDPATWREVLRVLKPGGYLLAFGGSRTYHRIACAIEDAGFELRDQIMWIYGSGFPKSHNLKGDWDGWGTALKPAHEPIVVARKPLIGTVAANVLAHGCGALNIDGCRISGEVWKAQGARAGGDSVKCYGDGLNNAGRSGGHDAGRWPANVIHDGSDEVLACFPDAPGQSGAVTGKEPSSKTRNVPGLHNERATAVPRGDKGSASRFFYCAKASKADRGADNNHPTVKPTDLMRYLCRLVTPPNGTVLDPFAGSGSTGKAAVLEGLNFIGIEREEAYIEIARERIAFAQVGDLV